MHMIWPIYAKDHQKCHKGKDRMFILATFIDFTVLVAFISWWRTRDDKLDTQEGYFLAGRGLTSLVIAGSLELTNLSA